MSIIAMSMGLFMTLRAHKRAKRQIFLVKRWERIVDKMNMGDWEGANAEWGGWTPLDDDPNDPDVARFLQTRNALSNLSAAVAAESAQQNPANETEKKEGSQ